MANSIYSMFRAAMLKSMCEVNTLYVTVPYASYN